MAEPQASASWCSLGYQIISESEYRKSGRIALITRYLNNHFPVTRYPYAHYDYTKQSQFQNRGQMTEGK
jgi:hypothetical protein